MAVIELDFVNEYRDRTGKKRRYFRRGRKRLGAMPGEVGSESSWPPTGIFSRE